MKLKNTGKNTLNVEVIQISCHGLWLIVHEEEYFLPFEKFPWFKKGMIEEIHNVQLLHEIHLRWPDLDIDLELNSLKNLEHYPLVFKD